MTLQEQVEKQEMAKIAREGDTLASRFESSAYTSHFPNKPEVTVSVRLRDPVEGRSVRYFERTLKSEAAKCNLNLKRDDKNECRYSRDEGPDSMNDIPGVKFVSGRMIKPNSRLNDLETQQVRAFLDPKGQSQGDVRELILATDDQELSSGTLSLPNGRTLSYLGAYGGDNPFGIYFEQGSLKVVGDNSDGSVCVR